MATQTTGSVNIASLDSKIIVDMCAGKFYVDLSPTVYIGSGKDNVLGAKVKILNPFDVIIKDFAAGYDISQPMTSIYEFSIPTQAGNYQFGKYTIIVQITDADGTTYEIAKVVSPCAVHPTRKYGTIGVKFTAKCKEGKLFVSVNNPPIYKGLEVSSSVATVDYQYPTGGLPAGSTPVTSFSMKLFEGVYKIDGETCATYSAGDNIYYKVNYKFSEEKNVKCIIDECCVLEKLVSLHKQLNTDCTDKQRQETTSVIMDALRLLKTAQLAEQCGEDPTEYIDSLENLLGCPCTCECNNGVSIITDTDPAEDVIIEGCGIVVEQAGLTKKYTIDNYEYKVSIENNDGALIKVSETTTGCSVETMLRFDISVVYTKIKTLANANTTEAAFWASVINKPLDGINISGLSVTTTQWAAMTFAQRIEEIIKKINSCCGCEAVILDHSAAKEEGGTGVLIGWVAQDAYAVDVFIDGEYVDTVLVSAGSSLLVAGMSDGAAHEYVLIPKCANGSIGAEYQGQFSFLGCPNIAAPNVSTSNYTGECPVDLTALVDPLPAGITAEWHNLNNTYPTSLVGDPTNVSSDGVYYVFAKDGNGCYSSGVAVSVVCQDGSCTAPQNIEAVAVVSGTVIKFQSAAYPPPANSYTVKRRLASDPDVPASYTTIGDPTFNASTARWEITDTTAALNTLYVYRAISNCSTTAPYIDIEFANVECKMVQANASKTAIGFSLVPQAGVTKYDVILYNDTETQVLQTKTYNTPFDNPIIGSFNGLDSNVGYKIKLRIYVSTYSKLCPYTRVVTHGASADDQCRTYYITSPVNSTVTYRDCAGDLQSDVPLVADVMLEICATWDTVVTPVDDNVDVILSVDNCV